ncbi:B3 domain-containing transcription factor VRN1-like [Trifolium medium]|uniref:B3 domain-containing transcription factor VRN1-like n=1 Tax=Trifolium medium TaxID=97028 RepID=A0A392NNQ8_9FABA|nr:B3 domain-containing transcription factor VRN1-like [Trifolium medium]
MKDFEGIARIRRVGEDRTWEVEVKYDREGDYSLVNSGWKAFSKEYNLQTGDVCKFKMTRSDPLSFTIAITRASEERSRKK